RHEADARVLQLPRDHARDLLADLLRDALHPPGHSDSYCASRSSMFRALPASPATLRSVDSRCTPSVFTETTATRARCQRSWCSPSASETLKRLRMRVSKLRRACRLSLSERAPGKCRSSVSRPMTMSPSVLRSSEGAGEHHLSAPEAQAPAELRE